MADDGGREGAAGDARVRIVDADDDGFADFDGAEYDTFTQGAGALNLAGALSQRTGREGYGGSQGNPRWKSFR